jgi:hypothetical protein
VDDVPCPQLTDACRKNPDSMFGCLEEFYVRTMKLVTKARVSPSGRSLETAFSLNSVYKAFIHELVGLEPPNFFIVGTQETDNVANTIDAWIDFFLVDADNTLIAFLGVFHPFKAKPPWPSFESRGAYSQDCG